MRVLNLRNAALALVAGVGLAGCAYGPYGGVGVGYGNYGYNDPYYGGYGGYGYGAGYGYGYGMPYYGWYDGFYYPGSGYYVYDRYRRAHRWTDAQRRYWEWRRKGSRPSTSATGKILQNWADFQDGPRASTQVVRQQSIDTGRTHPVVERRQVRVERQQAQRQVRAERQESKQTARAERREERIERRHSRKDD